MAAIYISKALSFLGKVFCCQQKIKRGWQACSFLSPHLGMAPWQLLQISKTRLNLDFLSQNCSITMH